MLEEVYVFTRNLSMKWWDDPLYSSVQFALGSPCWLICKSGPSRAKEKEDDADEADKKKLLRCVEWHVIYRYEEQLSVDCMLSRSIRVEASKNQIQTGRLQWSQYENPVKRSLSIALQVKSQTDKLQRRVSAPFNQPCQQTQQLYKNTFYAVLPSTYIQVIGAPSAHWHDLCSQLTYRNGSLISMLLYTPSFVARLVCGTKRSRCEDLLRLYHPMDVRDGHASCDV